MNSAVLAPIVLDQRGVAWIEGTRTKVIEVALDHLAQGWSPDEIHFQHPHLSLGLIHAALSYYFTHEDELNAEIERQYRAYRQARDAQQADPHYQSLRSRWLDRWAEGRQEG